MNYQKAIYKDGETIQTISRKIGKTVPELVEEIRAQYKMDENVGKRAYSDLMTYEVENRRLRRNSKAGVVDSYCMLYRDEAIKIAIENGYEFYTQPICIGKIKKAEQKGVDTSKAMELLKAGIVKCLKPVVKNESMNFGDNEEATWSLESVYLVKLAVALKEQGRNVWILTHHPKTFDLAQLNDIQAAVVMLKQKPFK